MQNDIYTQVDDFSKFITNFKNKLVCYLEKLRPHPNEWEELEFNIECNASWS